MYRFESEYQKQLFGAKGLKKNYTPQLDHLIIGSDEVFNCLQDNPRVGYSKELFGANSHAKSVVSYAASFGNTTLEKIQQYGKETEIASWLSAFDNISVRDRNSFEVVKKLTGREAEIHLDPVLMYDFTAEMSSVNSFMMPNEKYMIVYTYANRLTEDEIKFIKEYAKAQKLKIVGINAYYDFFDEWVHDHPLNVLHWFNHAECIVTDTFHGTIFSVINHKRFATIIRQSKNGSYGNHEKLYDLLERISLTERIVNKPEQIGKLLETDIDFCVTDAIIRKEREHTYDYLKMVLR